MSKKIINLLVFTLVISLSYAQVSIGTDSLPADPSSILDVRSTSRGFLLPRMTSEQRRSIQNPAAGLVVFDTDRKAAYLYNGTSWKAITLSETTANSIAAGNEASDGAMGDGFAINVKMFGKYAALAAFSDDIGSQSDQGSVYIYQLVNGSWTFFQKLIADDGVAGDNFGSAIAIDSNYLMVGAFHDDIGENLNQGSVYIYTLNDGLWVKKQKVTGSNGGTGDAFGYNISIHKNTMVVGAAEDDIAAATDAGSAYIFNLDSASGIWNESQKIVAPDGTGGDFFGNWVSMDQNKIVITAIYDDVSNIYRRGSAYVFTRQNGSWAQTSKIVASDGMYNDCFGTTAVVHGDYIFIGSFGTDGQFINQGAVYVYKLENNVWTQKQRVVANDAGVNGFFGQSIAINDNYAVIGAHGFNSLRGAAYIFKWDPVSSVLTQLEKIIASDAVANDYMGWSVDINNYNVIIGAYGKNYQKGAVYFKSID